MIYGVNIVKIRVTDLRQQLEINVDDIVVDTEALIGIDASTNNTGVCIIDCVNEKPIYSIELKRDKGSSAIEYKVEFKQVMTKILFGNRGVYANVVNIVQEEPFISAMKTTSEVLMALRTSIPEILIENKPLGSKYIYHEMNNKTWKKKLFYPDKCPNNSELEKKKAKEIICRMFPIYENLSQDEIDSTGIALISTKLINSGEGIKKKERVSRFKYNIEFIGAFDIESAIEEINYMSIPSEVKNNGLKIVSMPSNGDFDKKVYTEMGEEDMLLMFEFSKKTAGNIILKYRLYDIASRFDNLYAVVWRQNRKK